MPSSTATEFPLTQAPKRIPGRPHINTVRRWSTVGCGGVVLKTWRYGNTIVTTDAAIADFRNACTAQKQSSAAPTAAPTDAQARAERRLDEMGVKADSVSKLVTPKKRL